MSERTALAFLAAVRERDDLRAALLPPGASPSDLDSVLRVARDAGFAFSKTDLQRAFRHDWTMRVLQFPPGSLQPSER